MAASSWCAPSKNNASVQRIEFLPHTADIRLRLRAGSAAGIFRAGLDALNQLLCPEACTEGQAAYCFPIFLTAPDLTALLVDFLSEVLTETYTRKAVFCKAEIIDLSDTKVKVRLLGYPVDGFSKDIKAITYHEAEVKQVDGGQWEASLIFDI